MGICMGETCQRFPPLKQLLANVRQLHPAHGYLPAGIAPGDFGAHRAADDLVPETDADDADGGVGEGLADEVDEREDPGWGVEGAVSCSTGYEWLANSQCQSIGGSSGGSLACAFTLSSLNAWVHGTLRKVTATHLIR